MDFKKEDWEEKYDKWKKDKNVKNSPNSAKSKNVIHNLTDNIEKDISIVKEDIEKVEKKIEESLDLKHRPKLKLSLTFIAYLIPLIVLGLTLTYVFGLSISSKPVEFSSDIGLEGDNDKGNSLYIEESKALSPHVKYGEETYREIIKTVPFNITFKSSVKIPEDSEVILSLEFIGTNASLSINDELEFSSLENYEKFVEFEDSIIFKKKGVVENIVHEENNAQDFMLNNYYGADVHSYIPLNLNYSVSGYQERDTIINNTFRGSLNFLFYKEGNLSLTFKKEDLNWYQGEDNYTLIIRNLSNEVIYSEILKDDGDQTNSRVSFAKDFDFSFNDLNGIYYLVFENGGVSTDSSIKEIKLNTNKVVFYHGFLPLDKTSFYIKNYYPTNLTFFYWHPGMDQNITLNNETIYLGKQYDGIQYNYPLKSEEYTGSVQKGDISIINSFIIAPKKENWFDIPLMVQEDLSVEGFEPEFIIFDKNNINFTEDGFTLYYRLSNQEEQVLELKASHKNQLKLRKMKVNIK